MKWFSLSVSQYGVRRYAAHNGLIERRCGACDRMALEVSGQPPKVGDLVADSEGNFYLVKEVVVEKACDCDAAPKFWVAGLKRLTRTGAKLHGGKAAVVIVECVDDVRKKYFFRPIRWS